MRNWKLDEADAVIRKYKLTPKMIGALGACLPSNASARALGREQTIAALQRRGMVHADRRLTWHGMWAAGRIFWEAPSIDDLHVKALAEDATR